MNFFVINLPQHTEKRERMESLLASQQIQQYEMIVGTDGLMLSDKDVNDVSTVAESIRNIKRPLGRTELGCALSHLSVYRKILNDNIDQAIILEDDIVFDDRFNLGTLDQIKSNYDIVLLGASTHDESLKISDTITCIEKNESHNVFGTFAYYITNQGAKKMLHQYEQINFPMDSWTLMSRRGIKIGILVPLLISVDMNLGSYIAQERADLRKKYIYNK